MTRLFLECAIRAALIVIGTAIVLYAMRVKVAAVKHRVWTAVLLLMLALPFWTAWGPKAQFRLLPASVERVVTETAPPIPAIPQNGAQVALPVNGNTPARQPLFSRVEEALLGFYLLGAFVLLTRLGIGTAKANRLIRESVESDGIRTNARCVAPVTVGCLRPTVILPETWRNWSGTQLTVVMAHEGEHVRRRDPLVQWLALLNRAIFWFHPAAWWLERELSALAEEACDAAVIAQGHDPRDYAEILMNIARDVMDSGTRINSVAVAMPGPRLPQRIRQIIDERPAPRISRARMACLVAACVVMGVALAAGTLARARQNDGQSGAAAAPGERPKFEVASVKPCEPGDLPPAPPTDGGRGGGGGNAGLQLSPGRLTVTCRPVRVLIAWAYGDYADGPSLFGDIFSALNAPIEGLPSWGNSKLFTISAEAPGDASKEMMMGPMMQTLLEDRFQLKIRVETRDVPVYDLTVAKGGPKLPEADRTICRTMDPNHPGERLGPVDEPNCTIQLKGVTMADFAQLLRGPLGVDRPVIDKTGLTRTFSIHMVWAIDRGTLPVAANLPEDPPGTPTIFEALKEQLGLELVPAKGPDKVLVIDHIEEPSPN